MQLEAQYRTIKNSLRCSACVYVCVCARARACVCVCVCVWCSVSVCVVCFKAWNRILDWNQNLPKRKKEKLSRGSVPPCKSFLGSVRKLLVSVDALYTLKVRRTPLQHPSNGSYEEFPYYIMNPPNPKPSLQFSLANEYSQATKCSLSDTCNRLFPF